MGFLFPKPEVNIPPSVEIPEPPRPPEETARRIRRPSGLAQSQSIAQQKGITQLGLPISGLSIPDF